MSATVNAVSEPGASVLPAEPGDCAARRSRLASIGLVLILVGASVFAVWSSQAIKSQAARFVTRVTVARKDGLVTLRVVMGREVTTGWRIDSRRTAPT